LDLIVETETLTPSLIAALCAARAQTVLICDRCQEPDEVVVATMEIPAMDETFTLYERIATRLSRGLSVNHQLKDFAPTHALRAKFADRAYAAKYAALSMVTALCGVAESNPRAIRLHAVAVV
jgi:hypothetical protein